MQTIKTFIKDHPHMWWGLYLPVYLGGFFLIEHLITDNYWATQTFIDEYIPFCEYFVIPYDSWGFLLLALGLYLIVKDAEGFRPYVYLDVSDGFALWEKAIEHHWFAVHSTSFPYKEYYSHLKRLRGIEGRKGDCECFMIPAEQMRIVKKLEDE